MPVTTGAALPCSTAADALRGNDPTHQPFSMHKSTLTRARNRTPITFRFEPAGFGEGNAQPTLWKRWRRLNTLATTMNWDFCCVIHSVLQTMTSCLISRGGIFENDEDKYDCQPRKNSAHKYDWKMIASAGKTFPTKMIRKVNFSHQND